MIPTQVLTLLFGALGGDRVHSGCGSYAVGLLVYTSNPAMAAMGHCFHDWLLPIWPTDVDWTLWG